MDNKVNLPGYELIDKVASGGMSTVWTARQISLDRVVAVKFLSPQLVADAEAIRQFRTEALAAARLNHPGIVQVYDAGEHEGHVYLVMEYVAGCTVTELLARRKPLPEKHALLIAEGVALALGYAWEQARIIHCDIKPDNILLDRDGTVKLADLGLARFMGSTGTGVREFMEGTPNYASPEQVRGESDLDCRTDIYSLGATLYHIATGMLPFARMKADLVMEQQLSGYLPDPQEVNFEVSAGTAWLIEKMMVKDRTIRYQAWSDVQADIEAVRAAGFPASRPPAAGQSTIMRSEVRAAPPKAGAKAEKPAGKAAAPQKAAAKQKIVLSKDLRDQLKAPRRERSNDLTRALFAMVLLAMAVLAGYGILAVSRFLPHPEPEPEEPPVTEEDLRITVVSRSKPVEKPRPVLRMPEPGETPVRVASTAGKPIQWQDPTFLKGARLFNDALAKYADFTATKKNPAVLKDVERQCREAVAAFELCRSSAPPEVDIQDLITQCYHLISDTRHSMLVSSAEAGSQPALSGAQGGARPSVAAAPAPAKPEFVLPPTWNIAQGGGESIWKDLGDLLAPVGQASDDVSDVASLILYGEVTYLMPAGEAASKYGQQLPPRKPVSCPGFPKDALFYYTVDGKFGNGFNRMLLVADSADHVVAVQLVNEHPDESLWLDANLFMDKWHSYNFIQGRTKGSVKWKIAHRVASEGRIVRIDSELVSDNPNGYFGLGDSKERVSLYLPQQLVNLVLFRIQTLKKG